MDLGIFLSFFKKKYNDWIKCKLPKSRFKWTGLWVDKKMSNILCEILGYKTKKSQLHEGFANVVKLIIMYESFRGVLHVHMNLDITSESRKKIPSIVVIHYCVWYPFSRLRRYFCFEHLLNTLLLNFYHPIFHLSHLSHFSLVLKSLLAYPH